MHSRIQIHSNTATWPAHVEALTSGYVLSRSYNNTTTQVYPVGISLTDAAIVGITQRIVRQGPRAAPPPQPPDGPLPLPPPPACFPVPEAQPVLPCLLRRLLLRGALPEARALALRHRGGPHFSRSLEWLLFTALEAEVEAGDNAQVRTHSWQVVQQTRTLAMVCCQLVKNCLSVLA